MKRFLLITMTIIMTALMLATTAFAADDSITMIFDDKTIKMSAQEDCTAILNITIQIGDTQETISKEVKLQEKMTEIINVEDLAAEKLSDGYKNAEAKIVNVTVEQGQSEQEQKENSVYFTSLIIIIIGFAIGLALSHFVDWDDDNGECEKGIVIVCAIIGFIIAVIYTIIKLS